MGLGAFWHTEGMKYETIFHVALSDGVSEASASRIIKSPRGGT